MKKILILLTLFLSMGAAFAKGNVCFIPKQDYSTGDRPISMNIVLVEPDSDYEIQLTYGNNRIHRLMRVENFARETKAYAAMNASYFKQDTGTPLGLTIIDGKLMTGPLMNRSVFGVDKDGNCFIGKVSLDGEITIGYNEPVAIYNINQPIICASGGAYLYNKNWGTKTPHTDEGFFHIAIKRNKIREISNNSIEIPENGYAIVVKNNFLPCQICLKDYVKYNYSLSPKEWCKAKYAFAAGPNLIVNGQKNIDAQAQNFGAIFANTRTARSAIGIKKDGTIILLTVDGKQKGISEGVSLSEMADIMLTIGAENAMNLDGGSSTQMVVEGKMVNVPTNKIGAKVTNAVIVVRK